MQRLSSISPISSWVNHGEFRLLEAIHTKKVRYNGDRTVDLPTINVRVEPGGVIEVDDDFNNALFEVVAPTKKTKGDK